jgi:hypothetical protein
MVMNGTDTSAFQPGTPNIGSNKFGWVKATEGVGWESPVWRQQIAAFRSVHDGAGYYHFANGLNTATAEAYYFWSKIKDTWQPGEPIALDIEGDFFVHTGDPIGWALAFCIVMKQLSGLTTVIYSDWAHIKSPRWNWQPLVDFGCGLWGAAYNSSGFGDPAPWPVIFCWQNSDKDESTGGDDDYCYGDLTTWRAYGTPQGAKKMADITDPIPRFGDDGKPDGTNTSVELEAEWAKANKDAVISAVNEAAKWVVSQVNLHVDQALQGLPAPKITLNDAQVATLAAQLVASAGPGLAQDVLAAYQAQITKK